MKKLATFLLLVAIFASFIAVQAFGDSATATISTEDVTVIAGSQFEVVISITNNPGIAAAAIEISFDDGLTLTGAKNGEAFSDLTLTPPKQLKNGVMTSGPCRFAWSGTDNVTDDGVILTLTFEARASIARNKKLSINIAVQDSFNEARETVNITAQDSIVSVITYIPGDVDGNGIINMQDVLMLCQYYVDGCKYDPSGYAVIINESAGDVDANGKINMVDVLSICQYYVDGCKYDPDGYAVELLPGKMDCKHENLYRISAKDATCVTDGNIEYWYCRDCKNYFSDANGNYYVDFEKISTPATGHKEVITEAVEQTCTKPGLTEGKRCANCGVVWIEPKETPALGHNYEKFETIDATCTESAKVTYKCSRCEDEYTVESGAALGHNITGVTPTEELVENCEYVLNYECKTCKETVEGEHIFKHNYVASITKAATCSADGEKTLVCSVCGDAKTEKIDKNPTGHNWVEGEIANGERVDECSICAATKSVVVYEGNKSEATNAATLADKEIALADASIKLDKDVTDTIGNKEITVSVGTLSDEDKQDLVDEDKLEQIGNNPIYDFTINDGTSNISDLGGKVTITLPYELEEGEDVDSIAVWYISENGELVSIEATYNNGFVTFETDHFSYYTVTRLTPAERCALYGHNYATKHINGGCTNESYDYSVCIRCHDNIKENVVEPEGHSYIVAEESAVTCTEDGYTLYACENCKDYYEVVTPAIGHKWAFAESGDATCAEEGFETYRCENCDEEYKITYPKLPHEYTETIVPATEDEQGYTLHQCVNCSYNYKSDFVAAIGSVCNHFDLTKVRYELPEETCGGYFTLLTCACGKEKILYDYDKEYFKFNCRLENASQETYYFDDNGIEHSIQTMICPKCGLTVVGDFYIYYSNNETVRVFNYVFSFNGVDLLEFYEDYGHYYVESYDFINEEAGCEGGCYVTCLCSKCGKTYRFTDEGHVITITSIDISEYGLCGGEVWASACKVCGEIYEIENINAYNCYWEYQGETDEGFKIYYCSRCKTTQITETIVSEKDENCEYVVTEIYRYLRNDKEIVSLKKDYTYFEHDLDYTYEFVNGANCEDGYNVTAVCKDCGYTEYWQDSGHRTDWREIDLTEYGLCGGYIREEYCLVCGTTFDRGIHDNYCNWNYQGETDEGFEIIYCSRCNTTRITKVVKGEKNENCEYETTVTLRYLRGGEELFTFEYTYTDVEHNIEYVFDLPEGNTCYDGYTVYETCIDCGYIWSSGRRSGHWVDGRKIDLAEYGLCGGYIYEEYCLVCGTVTGLGRNDFDCNWNYIETAEYGFEAYYCSKCGTTRLVKTEYSEKDENCRYNEIRTLIYLRDEEELVTFESVNTYTNHVYEYEVVERFGETCDDGYRFMATCKDCGSYYEETYYGHYTTERRIDLAEEYDLCGGEIYLDECIACGTVTWFSRNDYACNWNYQGRTEDGFEMRYCSRCNTVRLTKTSYGEKDENCRYAQTNTLIYLRDGDELLNYTYTSYSTYHRYEFTSVEFENGENCEDGYRCTLTCLDCGYTTTGSGSGHSRYTMERINLEQFGACSGWIYFQSCPCGMNNYVGRSNLCTDRSSSNQYVDEDGKMIYVYTETCDDCDLRYSRSYYIVKDVENCKQTVYNTLTVTVGKNLVGEWYYKNIENVHDYVVTKYIFDGEENCESGVTLFYTCKNCGVASYSSHDSWHNKNIIVERIDLSEYGCVCGGEAIVYRCACGQYMNVNIEDCLCEFERNWCEPWIDSYVPEQQYNVPDTNGYWDNYYNSGAEIYTCAVTDPACAFKIRYCSYWVKDAETCTAYQYQTWQFGYDNVSEPKEITIKFGNYYICHNYEETVDGNVTRYDCLDCDCYATYEHPDTVIDDNTRVYTHEWNAYNPMNDGRNKSFKCIEQEIRDANTGNLLKWSYYSLYEDKDGFFRCCKEEYTYFDITTYTGENYRTDYRTYYFYGENGAKDETTGEINYGYWEQDEYEYSFDGECTRTTTRTGSNYYKPEVYVENACDTRLEWITEKERTCTQDGYATAYRTCRVCGKEWEDETVYFRARGHRWAELEDGGYYCVLCGMESTNGANGRVSFEDLTDYEDGKDYIIGYCINTNVRFEKYVLLILPDGEKVVVRDIEITKLEEPRAFAVSKQAVAEFAEANGYDEYKVSIAFVPEGDDGSLDYAIVFERPEIEFGVFTDAVSFVDYLYNGETATYTIAPKEDAVWIFDSNSPYDYYSNYYLCANLYDSEGNKLNQRYFLANDNGLICELKAGETYKLQIKWGDNANGYYHSDYYLPLVFKPLSYDSFELFEFYYDGTNSYVHSSYYLRNNYISKIIVPSTAPNGYTVTGISGSAFRFCYNLSSVTIPQSVTWIGDEAFRDCNALTEIIYEGTMEEWEAIEKYYRWDYNTGDYTVYCTDGEISK